MRIQHIVPVIAILALPLAAQGQTRVEAEASASASATGRAGEGETAVEARGTAHARLAREALVREEKDGRKREPSGAETRAGAAALAAGATAGELITIREAAPPGRELTASLSALAELRGEGVSGARAAAQIASRLRAGASDRMIAGLAGEAGAAADLRGAASLGALGGGLDAGLGVMGAVGGILR